jgi:TonB-dependent starch-binding outer membrane protein SusC
MKNNLVIRLLFAAFALVISNLMYAQTIISGKVVDESGLTLPGVNVLEMNTTNGTATDLDGNYRLEVQDKATIIFSFIGYLKVEVPVNGRTIINITMEPDATKLDEVVVVGYGTQKRSDVTGAVTSLSSDFLKDRPITNVEEALQGQVSGLSISSTGGQPGAATKMNIRGISSVSGSSQPLIVIDGFPMNQTPTSGGGNLEQFSSQIGGFAFINPDDIESVEVLKDASATAIYGNRGANGVIMITTKKGKKGKSGITFSTYFGSQVLDKRINVMNFKEYAKYQQATNPNNRLFTAANGTLYDFPDADQMNLDWQDEIYRRGSIQNYSLSLQGKNDATSYSFSSSYNKNESILTATNFEKLSARLALDHKFSKLVTVGTNISYSRIENNGVPTDGREGTAAGIIIGALSENPFRMDNNTQARFRRAGVPQVFIDNYISAHLSNPDNIANNTSLDKNINRVIGNLYADFALTNWLSFRSTLGLDFFTLTDQQFYSRRTPWGNLNKGIATAANNNAKNIVNENYFTLSKTFNAHKINFVTGFSYQNTISDFNRAEARSFKNENLGYKSLQGASEFLTSSSADKLNMLSYLGRANYSYDDRYLATFTYRRDGTSRFQNNKWGNFYSGAVAWNVSNEAFLKDSRMISTLKLRASLGQVGNAGVPVQGALLDQQYSNYTFNRVVVNGVSPQNLENKDLTWETTTQYNAGIDLGLYDNAFNFTADYFVKNTTDLLLLAPVSISTGFSQGWFNIGEVKNSGFEFSGDYRYRSGGGFAWNSKLNVSAIQSEIKALGNDGEPIYIDVNFDAISTDEVILKVGGSINDLYGYKTNGIYLPGDFKPDGTPVAGVPTAGAGERAGDIKYTDLSGPKGVPDGLIDGFDRTVLGNTMPELYGSWSNGFSFKGVELDIIMQYSYGNEVFNATNTRIASFPGGDQNQTSNWSDRWTEKNPNNTQYARVPSLRPADYLVEDGSFIRLQTVRVGYNLPLSWLTPIKIKSAKVYVAANNLAVFTNYSGYDPEVTSNQVDYRYPFVQGFDYGGFPRAKTFIAGLNVEF